MIAPPTGVRVYLACGYTDMRKGARGLTMLVQQVLAKNPFDEGTVFVIGTAVIAMPLIALLEFMQALPRNPRRRHG